MGRLFAAGDSNPFARRKGSGTREIVGIMSAPTQRKILIAAVLAVGLPLLFMGPTLLLGRPLIRDDASLYVYPQFHAYAECLKSGHLYLWDPMQYGGLPALATGQSMGLYPPHLLLFRLLPWQTAIAAGYWLHLALAFAGFVLVARRLGLSVPAAAPGGLLYTYSGYQAGHLVHYSFVASLAYFPLLLWLLDRALVHSRWRDWGLLALAAAAALLVAHPQIYLMSMAACVLWVIASGWRSASGQPAPAVRLWGGLALSVLTVGLLVMPQVLPTAELAAVSRETYTEGSLGSVGFMRSCAYGPLDVVRLFVPNLFGNVQSSLLGGGAQFHETCAYVGLGGMLFALVGLVLGYGRRGWWFCVVALVAGGLLMWSGNPLYGLIGHLPFVNTFRAMGRWAFVPILALGLLTAMAVEGYAEAAPARRRHAHSLVTLVTILVVLALVALWLTFGAEGGSQSLPGRPGLAIPVANMAAAIYNWLVGYEPLVLLAGLALTLLALWQRLTLPLRAAVLGVAIALPLWQFWQITNPPGPTDFYTRAPETARAITADHGAGTPASLAALPPERVLPGGWPAGQDLPPTDRMKELLTPALGTVHGLRHIDGYRQGLVTPSAYRLWEHYYRYGTQTFTGQMETTPQALQTYGPAPERMARMHRLCAAQYLVTPGLTADPALEVLHEGPVRVYKYRQPHPEAWFVGRVRVIPDPDEQLEAIKHRDFDLGREAVVDGDVAGLTGGAVVGTASLTRGYGVTHVTAEASAPALLVVAQAWYPGWRASLNGRPTALLRTNFGLVGVALPAGRHEVKLVFAPRPYRVGLVLAGAGLLLLVWLVWAGAGPRKPGAEEVS